jgi:hypothetical protein
MRIFAFAKVSALSALVGVTMTELRTLVDPRSRRWSSRARVAIAALSAAALAGWGCAASITCRPQTDIGPTPPDAVDVTFLGAAGLLVEHGSDVLLMGPFFTNPTLGELATQDFYSDGALIKALLPSSAARASAIVVGHAHYDHLMDVPYIALEVAPKARIYANDAAGKILAPLAPELDPKRLVSVEAPGSCVPGVTPCRIDIPGTGFRLWPIRSEHSAQFKGKGILADVLPPFTLWRGEPLKPLSTPPSRAGQWPGGTTFAYLVDIVDATGAPVFRMYYQDSGTRPPIGHPPHLSDGKGVDLAVLCLGGYITLRGQPQALLHDVQPRFAMAVHWENFFNPRAIPVPGAAPVSEKIEVLPNHHPGRYMRRVRGALKSGASACLPCPGLRTRLVRRGADWKIDATSGPGWTTVH